VIGFGRWGDADIAGLHKAGPVSVAHAPENDAASAKGVAEALHT